MIPAETTTRVQGLTRKYLTILLPYEAMQDVWAALGFVPTALQQPFLRSTARITVIYGGWRAGKSFLAVMRLVAYPVLWRNTARKDGLSGLIWIIGPTYQEAQAEFDYFVQAYRTLGIIASLSQPVDEGWSLTTTTGWKVETRSSKNVTSLGSFTLDAIILAEANQHPETILTWCMGRLSETRGPLVLSGTLEDAYPWYGQLKSKYPVFPNKGNTECFSIPSWANPLFLGEHDPSLVEAREHCTWDEWRIKYCGIPAPVAGAVWREFRASPDVIKSRDGSHVLSQGPVCHVWEGATCDPDRPVYLAVDPGEYYAVMAFHWVTLEQTRIIDGTRCYMPGMIVFDEIYIKRGHFDLIRDELLAKPWFSQVVTSYHDRASKQHHNQDSQSEKWSNPIDQNGMGIDVLFIESTGSIATGVDTFHRWLLHPMTGMPLLYVHPSCVNFIEEMHKERYPDSANMSSNSKPLPVDRHNHARKALTYAITYQHGDVYQLDDDAATLAMLPLDMGPGF